ncbi:PREDICTED: dynein intermediate chain 2, ciliary [Nicrophorus vespilloides]|uniref:Dynein intermediate chain 2, ciliary n=1 Tax=Nicrophorus vespilloides TaxID=110193 RepID=A0ABM1M4H9_NICVS|nr:PREDICTED: dynein intermediate chain 2, ciliary [Nicrophorus vespilloides]
MPPKPATKKKKVASPNRVEVDDDLEEWKKSKQLLKPKDQIELQDFELKELVGRTLVMTNNQIPNNIVEFSYVEKSFIPVPQVTNYIVAYECRGTIIHRDTEEAKAIIAGTDGEDGGMLNVYKSLIFTPIGSEEFEDKDKEKDEEAPAEQEDVGESEGVEAPVEEKADEEKKEEEEEIKPVSAKKLTNQFNFCERAALTYTQPPRMQETQTTPPPVKTFSGNVLQWIIYDSYQIDYAEQLEEKERERERKEKDKAPVSKYLGPPRKSKKKLPVKKGFSEEQEMRIFECWKVLERMINLNTYDEIAKDYRYWEDPSDEFREEEGTLLPLWKYSYDKTKKHTVTHICWNPWYYDLFIVCFGYLEFLKPLTEGFICLFTIKNPSYPETICLTESAVMCSDIHPKYPYMMVCGMFDGNIQVYNIQASAKQPAYMTKSHETKHSGIIWAIKWVPDLPDGELNFYSVSNDGKVNNYVLMQTELSLTTIINLYLDRDAAAGPDGTLVKLKACATYIVLHPSNPIVYMVGTEEGLIYKCSINYNAQYLMTYQAHTMPVYKIHYNKYNSSVFISCSGDWRIKIWEDNRADPLFVFDLGASVMDVEWAPYSSTVFGAVTAEGKVYVYDLNVNKYKPICTQAVVSKKRNKLTTIAFNYNMPIVIVGDDKGMVTCVKLSPNLRVPCKPPKKQQHLDQWTLQCMKLDRLLALVREPSVLAVHTDISVSDKSTI